MMLLLLPPFAPVSTVFVTFDVGGGGAASAVAHFESVYTVL